MRRSNHTVVSGALGCLLLFGVWSATAFGGAKLVSDDLIVRQKALTSVSKLSNGIPVILRQVAGSDVGQINVVFASGYKDIPTNKKTVGRWMASTMSRAAQGFPRQELYALTAKYGFGLACGEGIESSSCTLSTVTDYWKIGLPLLAAVVTTPSLTDEDLALVRDRILADLRNTPSDPSGYVNELVNNVFYPKGYPYFTPYKDEIAGLEKAKAADARDRHKAMLNASRMIIVVVSSIPDADMRASLESLFGKIPSKPAKPTAIPVPRYSPSRFLSVEDRDVPNGYVHLKFNIPGSRDKDATVTQFMLAVLSEKLFEELRTKRSLSYSAYAYPRLYEVGIGVMGASTSNIKSTMEGMAQIVHQMQDREMTDDELSEYKMSYATEFFLTQESHVALAGALASSWLDFGTTDYLYEMPARIEKVTAGEVRRVAKTWIKELRAGVIARKDKFDEKWFKEFVRSEFASRK